MVEHVEGHGATQVERLHHEEVGSGRRHPVFVRGVSRIFSLSSVRARLLCGLHFCVTFCMDRVVSWGCSGTGQGYFVALRAFCAV